MNVKKLICLVLAVMLALSAVSAFAEEAADTEEAAQAAPELSEPEASVDAPPAEEAVEEAEPLELISENEADDILELPAPDGAPEAEVNAGDLPINATTFPDPVFRQYVKDAFAGGGDTLSEADCLNVTEINVTDMGVADLSGVASFPNLTGLYCDNNALTALDVSGNTALEVLDCGFNGIEALDVRMLPRLQRLWVDGTRLRSLDTRSNPDLEDLQCSGTFITGLDVSANPKLRILGCSSDELGTLDVSRNAKLERLSCWGCALTALDLSHCPALFELNCENNSLQALDLSHNPKLSHAVCDQNSPLQTLTLGSLPDLEWLNCAYCPSLTRLSLDECPALLGLACHGTGLSELDIRRNIHLIRLYRKGAKAAMGSYTIYSLDEAFAELAVNDSVAVLYETADPSDIPINEAAFPDPALRQYVLDRCDVTGDGSLSRTEIANVTELQIGNLGIARLDGIEVFDRLTDLVCEGNAIAELSLSGLPALTYVICSGNPLTRLDVTGNAALYSLDCVGCGLETLDLSGNPNLEILECRNNRLNGLDISRNPVLQELDISGNPLTSVSITQCPRLVAAYRNGPSGYDASEGWIIYEHTISDDGGTTEYRLRVDQSDTVLAADAPTVTIAKNMKYTAMIGEPFLLMPGGDLKAVDYATSDADVAAVDPSTGLVTPKESGKAKITVQVLKGTRKKKLTLTLTVKNPRTPEKLVLKKKGTLTVDLAQTPSVDLRGLFTVEPATASEAVLEYSTTAKTVKIDDDNVLTHIPGQKMGNVTVKVVSPDHPRVKLSIKLKLTDSSLPTGIKLDPRSIQKLTLGADPLTLRAVLIPATAVADVEWASTNEDVAAVQNGVVTARSVGKATISATVVTAKGKKVAKVKVTVSAAK